MTSIITSPLQAVVSVYWPTVLVAVVPQAVPSGFFAVTVALPTGPFTTEPLRLVSLVAGAGVGVGVGFGVGFGFWFGFGFGVGVGVGAVAPGIIGVGLEGLVEPGAGAGAAVPVLIAEPGPAGGARFVTNNAESPPPPQAVAANAAMQIELKTNNLLDIETPVLKFTNDLSIL